MQTFACGAAVYNGGVPKLFYTKAAFYDILLNAANASIGDVYVFAHNASYDLSLTGIKKDIILGEKLGTFKRADKFMVENVVYVKYQRQYKRNGKRQRQQLIFLDSYQLLHGSLKSLAATFAAGEKYASDEDYSLSPAEWNKYIRENGAALAASDAEILYNILTKFFARLERLRVPFGITLPSMAWLYFKLNILDTTLRYRNDTRYNANILEAYRGGFNNLFAPGAYKYIRDYDVNSLYPYSMANRKMPKKYIGYHRQTFTLPTYRRLAKKYYVIADVEFILPRDVQMSFIVKKIYGKLIPLQGGRLWLHQCEIDWLISHNALLIMHGAYLYEYSTTLFDDYVYGWYKIKNDATARRDEGLRTIAKLFLNTLYGKTGQHRSYALMLPNETITQLHAPTKLIIKQHNGTTVITDYGYFHTIRDDQTIKYAPELAGAITAYARITLAKYVEAAGIENVIYCDTDSIHTTGKQLDKFISNDLGALKIENEGEAVYYAPKVYKLNDKWTYKGVNVKRSVQINENEWETRQFSRAKSTLWEGVSVQTKRKRMTLLNDKFKWTPARECFTEEEYIAAYKKRHRRLK